MFVKRFVADTMQEAIRKINNEFGPDAVILENKSVRCKGITGYFKKKKIEVVAAYEPNRSQNRAPVKTMPVKTEESVAPEKKREGVADSAQTNILSKQMQELKDVVQDFSNKIRIVNKETTLNYSSEVLRIYSGMMQRDVHEELCKEVAAQTQSVQNRRDMDAKTVALQLVMEKLGEPTPLKLKKFEQNVLLFAGPTGAGKTTTLAKLAGRLKFKEHLEVGIINTDTYRVGAMEQIRIYSEIMDIPLINVYNAGELKEALQTFADKDVVLIDTAGKSARDTEYCNELSQLIKEVNPNEVFLVISVVTGQSACREAVGHYSFIEDYKLIITKLDEVGVWGNVLNIADFSRKRLSYVTMGQNVPDDIREADTQRLAGSIIGDEEMCYD